MKQKNDTLYCTNTQSAIYPNGDTSFDIVENVVSGVDTVAPGPIISGDHKTPNAWSYNIEQATYYMGTLKITHDPGSSERPYFEQTGAFIGAPEPVEPWVRDVVYNAALSKVNNKIRGVMDLSVTIAERKQALQMINKRLSPKQITNIGRTLQRMLAYKKKILKNRKRGIDYSDDSQLSWRDGFTIPADLWLEFKYGWQPLVADVWSAADMLTNSVQSNLNVSDRVWFPMPSEKGVTSPVNGLGSTARGKGFNSCTIVVNLSTDIDPTHVGRFSSLNPASIAWELMPYSFVVDWFIDVGSYLRDLETALLYRNNIKSVMVSELHVHKYTYACKGITNENGIKVEADLAATLNLIKFERSIGSTSLIPRVPQYRAQLGSSRLFSAASLLAQFLKK